MSACVQGFWKDSRWKIKDGLISYHNQSLKPWCKTNLGMVSAFNERTTPCSVSADLSLKDWQTKHKHETARALQHPNDDNPKS